MLRSLHIKNYAIIDDLSIEFDKGFNVFTGETGAGKSIIVGALSLLLKGRVDTSVIKNGETKAIIEGVFDVEGQNMKDMLDEQDIEYEDEIIIKRVISIDNKSSIKINQSNVTLGFLTDLLSNYVDIHSQKDSQYLFDKKNQLYLLDKYGNTNNLLKEYQSAYRNYVSLKKEYEELVNNTYSEREIEFYHYDFDELDKADLKTSEEQELLDDENKIKQAEKYLSVLNNALNLYNKDSGVKEQLYDLFNSLNINDNKINEIKNNISNLYYLLDENMDNLSAILKDFSSDAIDIDYIEDRLYTYAKLKRKHKTDVTGLIKLRDELKLKIASFEQRDEVLKNKESEVIKAKEDAYNLAEQITSIRLKAKSQLEKEVLKETSDLLLNNCVFEIRLNKVELTSNGQDDVEFFVSMNKGEETRPLRNVASGGEVSRLLLALKSAFAKVSSTSLLILDEIDTGVSGNVGLAVGEKIAKIAKTIQVICISHLSTVAACANTHFYIYKTDENDVTSTHIKRLNYKEIISELAAISNTSSNQKAIDAAKELYSLAQERVKNVD